MITCEHCGKIYRSNVTPLHCRCGGVTGYVEPSREPRSTAWVRWIKLLRKPQDRGIGDTIARLVASVGLDRWKTFSKKLGMPCGCTDRQDAWNKQWPY